MPAMTTFIAINDILLDYIKPLKSQSNLLIEILAFSSDKIVYFIAMCIAVYSLMAVANFIGRVPYANCIFKTPKFYSYCTYFMMLLVGLQTCFYLQILMFFNIKRFVAIWISQALFHFAIIFSQLLLKIGRPDLFLWKQLNFLPYFCTLAAGFFCILFSQSLWVRQPQFYPRLLIFIFGLGLNLACLILLARIIRQSIPYFSNEETVNHWPNSRGGNHGFKGVLSY